MAEYGLGVRSRLAGGSEHGSEPDGNGERGADRHGGSSGTVLSVAAPYHAASV